MQVGSANRTIYFTLRLSLHSKKGMILRPYIRSVFTVGYELGLTVHVGGCRTWELVVWRQRTRCWLVVTSGWRPALGQRRQRAACTTCTPLTRSGGEERTGADVELRKLTLWKLTLSEGCVTGRPVVYVVPDVLNCMDAGGACTPDQF